MNKIRALEAKGRRLERKIQQIKAKSSPNYLDEYYLEKYRKELDYNGKILEIYKNSEKSDIKRELTLLGEARRRDEILHGNLLSTVITICLPIALYVFFNSFYSLLDSVMCATISASSVSDVAILAQIKNMVNAFGSGIAGGGAVLVSRYYGAGKMKEAREASGNCLTISLITSAFISVILIPLASVICKAVGCTGEDTGLYFSLQMLELAIVAVNTIFIGLEKVKGNSKRILVLNITSLLIKLLLNVTLIYVIRIDSIVWLEISSIIAQGAILAYALSTVFSDKNALRVTKAELRPRRIYISPILKLSIPVFFGKFVMNFGKFIVNLLSNIFYGAATEGLIVGALAVSNNLSGLITSPANAFEEGESTIVSQNIGAGNYKRTIDAFIRTSAVVMTFSMIGFVLVRFVFLDDLANLFAGGKARRSHRGRKGGASREIHKGGLRLRLPLYPHPGRDLVGAWYPLRIRKNSPLHHSEFLKNTDAYNHSCCTLLCGYGLYRRGRGYGHQQYNHYDTFGTFLCDIYDQRKAVKEAKFLIFDNIY